MTITPGVRRVAEELAARFRKLSPDIPASLADDLAELVEEETGTGVLVELLEQTLKGFTAWRELYAPTGESAGGGE